MTQKEILAYIDDMQFEAETANKTLMELPDKEACLLIDTENMEYNAGMIAAYNNVRSLMTNLEFAKNYTWFTGDGE